MDRAMVDFGRPDSTSIMIMINDSAGPVIPATLLGGFCKYLKK
jgi:hypothetical protein